MVAKKKATTGARGIKKLKLKRETLKDLDVSHAKRINGGTLKTVEGVSGSGRSAVEGERERKAVEG